MDEAADVVELTFGDCDGEVMEDEVPEVDGLSAEEDEDAVVVDTLGLRPPISFE